MTINEKENIRRVFPNNKVIIKLTLLLSVKLNQKDYNVNNKYSSRMWMLQKK